MFCVKRDAKINIINKSIRRDESERREEMRGVKL